MYLNLFGPNLPPRKIKRFFWSGLGRDGATKAEEIARTRGGVTLETTIADRGIAMPTWDASDPAKVKAWQDASKYYAEGANGKVHAVLGDNLRPGNIWETFEFPALKNNPRVTEIVKINPSTGTEEVLFRR